MNDAGKTIPVLLPQYGMGMTEAKVAQWLKREGDAVCEGEPIVEVESAKSVNEIAAPASGVLRKIWVGVDQEVKIYALLAEITPVQVGASAT